MATGPLFQAAHYRNNVSAALDELAGGASLPAADPANADINGSVVYACGLGGSGPVASALCAKLQLQGRSAVAIDRDTLRALPIDKAITVALVSASGGHPSLL